MKTSVKISAILTRAAGILSLAAIFTASTYAQTPPAKPLSFTGTNLSGAEFGGTVPGIFGKDYTYPTPDEVTYFQSKGMNVFRVPFLWERLQTMPQTAFVPEELTRLKTFVQAATDKGAVIILDPHDYARYHGEVIGGAKVSDADFADLWRRLAAEFKANSRVWFGLVNEPHDLPTAQWLSTANAAIAAIRKTGAKNLILVPGNGWTGAHSWVGAGNDALLGVKDPANHSIFEVHQYLDADSSGTHLEVVSATIGSERLRGFVDWCRKNHKRAFLGEFAVAANATGQAALGDMLTAMEKDRDVWVGYTWWSAGPWWGDNMFTLEPKDGVDRPQLATLRPHLQPVSAPRKAAVRN